MGNQRATSPVLVAVADPAHVQQLVRTAGDLARLDGGTVRLVSVVAKPHDSPFGIFDDETIRREFAGTSHKLVEQATPPPGVTIEREIVVARSVAKGILSAIEESDPTALVMGWHGPSRRSEAVLGTTVDTLVERAPCDMYVERIGREANGVDSVLLPVAGGPHVDAAARAATAIAVRNDARVVVVSVATADHGTDAAATYVEDGREAVAAAPGPQPQIETAVRMADSVTDGIVEEAAAHDVLVFGVTRQSAIRRQLVGSIPRRVVDRTDQTVIFARDAAVVDGPLRRLGALVGL